MAKLRVGLTGGIGSGKSAVAAYFGEFGATVIDADALAREVVAPGSDGLREIGALWPAAIGADGALDRG
ncbi:MAG: dephospho-CoA kinase, partial [Candidatus Eremiobacteraeota bacterium]|nr:dephospho-CoA kinase [Candidatus Eremiobacteraeota bacterium]